MWFWQALLSAVFGSIVIILNKRILENVSVLVLTWALFALSLPLIAVVALKDGPPSVNLLFFAGTFGSAMAFVISKSLTNHSIKHSQLSSVYPLQSLSVVFTFIFGLFLLGENVKEPGLIGLALGLIGVYILNLKSIRGEFFQPLILMFREKGSLFFLIAMVLNGISATFDKIGLNNSPGNNAWLVLLAEDVFMTAVLTFYLFWKRPGWIAEVQNNFSRLLLNSLLYVIPSILTFWSFSGGIVALASGVRKMQVLFVLVLGIFFLHERPSRYIWIGAILMILSALLVKIA